MPFTVPIKCKSTKSGLVVPAASFLGGDLGSVGPKAIGTGSLTRASAVSYWANANSMAWAAVNEPVFEYLHEVTGDESGWFRNDIAVTNSLPNTDMTDAAWSYTAYASKDAVDPFGNVGAVTLTDNQTGSAITHSEVVSCPDDSNPNLFQIKILKTELESWPMIQLYLSGGSTVVNSRFGVNTKTGYAWAATVPVTVYAFGVQDRGSWWLFWAYVTNNSTGNTNLQIAIRALNYNSDDDTTADNSLTGSQVVCHPQLQLNSKYPLPWVETTGSAASTAACSGIEYTSTDNTFKGIFDEAFGDAEGMAVTEIVLPWDRADASWQDPRLIGFNNSGSYMFMLTNCEYVVVRDGTNAQSLRMMSGGAFSAYDPLGICSYWSKSGNALNVGYKYNGSWYWDTEVPFDNAFATTNNFHLAEFSQHMLWMKNTHIYDANKGQAFIEANL